MSKNFKITSDNLLVVEGQDESDFFEALLNYLNIKQIQLINMRGKNKFAIEFFSLCSIQNFNSIKQIGFIRDAEKSCSTCI